MEQWEHFIFRAVAEFGDPNDLEAGGSWHFSRDFSCWDKEQGFGTALSSCLSLITGAGEGDIIGVTELHSAQVGVGMGGELGRE